MTMTWHKTEPREVRPFFQTAEADKALDNTAIRLFPDDDALSDPSFELDEIDFQRLAPVIEIAVVEPALWLPASIPIADVKLAVIATQSFLKRSEVIASHSLADELPAQIVIENEILGRMGGGRNVLLTVALCLSDDLEPAPGTPYLPGHWLARRTFLLRSRSMPTLFDLQTRTDEAWAVAGFPPNTFYAVDYAGGIAGELEDGGSVATVHIHIDAHNRMANNPIGETLQPLLAAEIISSIIMESMPEWKDAETIEPASPLATLAKQLGEGAPLTVSELRLLCTRPSKLRALLQSKLSVLRAIR